MKTIRITYRDDGTGTLTCVGRAGQSEFPCGAQAGRKYPKDVTLQAKEGVQGQCADCDKFRLWRSAEFNNAEMPWAIKIWGQVGIFIHEWPTLAGSSGCVHLLPGDAQAVYEWVDGRTRVLTTYPW